MLGVLMVKRVFLTVHKRCCSIVYIYIKINTVFPVCSCVEQHYLLSAVAGRRQDDRPSIRPQNKVKRLLFIPDLIPGGVQIHPVPVNKYSAARRRERNLASAIQTLN